MKPKSGQMVSLFLFVLTFLFSTLCFVPETYAASSNMIPNGDFEESIPMTLERGKNDKNTYTLETDPLYLNIPGGVNNGSTALRVRQETANAFVAYKVPLKRDTKYDLRFDVMVFPDNDGNS
ncbi:MAG: hypothetical protein LBB49_06020, partial [Gracilibacteraceae bacterium]|nr:hypothetical protein [Gracilibacteraceae bacterium]